ncbi:hypothetical protein EN871_34125, partial [bacterium M00.F.Ca.ET.228.01.1.1]
IEAWLKDGRTGWDAFPNTGQGKIDAQTGPLAAALDDSNIKLETGAHVDWLEPAPDGKSIAAIHYTQGGAQKRLTPKLVIVAAGALMTCVALGTMFSLAIFLEPISL